MEKCRFDHLGFCGHELLSYKKRCLWRYSCQGLDSSPGEKKKTKTNSSSRGILQTPCTKELRENQESGGEGGQQTCHSLHTMVPGASEAGRKAGRQHSQSDTRSTWHASSTSVFHLAHSPGWGPAEFHLRWHFKAAVCIWAAPHSGAPVLCKFWKMKHRNVGLWAYISIYIWREEDSQTFCWAWRRQGEKLI